MMRALGAVTVLGFLLSACATAMPEPVEDDGKRSPRWSSAIVTGGSVRGSGGS